jgi:hypothetical protein
MINKNLRLPFHIIYFLLSLFAFFGLFWITRFFYNVKLSNVDDCKLKSGVEIENINITISKISIVIIWIQLLFSFLILIQLLINHFSQKK